MNENIIAALIAISFMLCVASVLGYFKRNKKDLVYKTTSKIKIMKHESLELLQGNINSWLEASSVKPSTMQWDMKDGINVVIVSYVVLSSREEEV